MWEMRHMCLPYIHFAGMVMVFNVGNYTQFIGETFRVSD